MNNLGPIQFATPLGGLAWAILAGVPVGIIALYFLKLRRHPVQVPSTLLWRRSLEDLHVNSLFQRLRRNLLLFLQLLTIAFVMLALLGPRLKGTTGQGQRYVLAIDNSASMSATDITPSRLEKAKEEARKVVETMTGNDLAMIISFSDKARVVSNYTGNRSELTRRIDSVTPTEAPTSLREALQVAAGLANPSKMVEGVAATSIVTPELKIYTDGGFADVDGFSLGNLKPEVFVIGPKPPAYVATSPDADTRSKRNASDNVAILALQARRNDEKTDLFEVFGRAHNYRAVAVATEARLLRHDPANPKAEPTLIDAIALAIPAQSDQSFKFDLPDTGLAELEVRIDVKDALALDNRAFTLVGSPRKARVLVISEGNRYLNDTWKTPLAEQRAEVTMITPDAAKAEGSTRAVAAGNYDLVIYDGTRPDQPPEANALYFGAFPPGPAFEKPKDLDQPAILDWNVAHPLMQYVRDLSTIRILKAQTVDPPPGSTTLIETNGGPIAFVTPRSGFVDAVIGFPLMVNREFNTDWPLKVSFPLFLANALEVMGNARESLGEETHAPGLPVTLRVESLGDSIEVADPSGKNLTVKRSPQGSFIYQNADVTGLYNASWPNQGRLPFAVNLFDIRESDLSVRGLAPDGAPEALEESYKIKIGYNPVQGTQKTVSARNDWWWLLATFALIVVLLEWYIYNRRVYI